MDNRASSVSPFNELIESCDVSPFVALWHTVRRTRARVFSQDVARERVSPFLRKPNMTEQIDQQPIFFYASAVVSFQPSGRDLLNISLSRLGFRSALSAVGWTFTSPAGYGITTTITINAENMITLYSTCLRTSQLKYAIDQLNTRSPSRTRAQHFFLFIREAILIDNATYKCYFK